MNENMDAAYRDGRALNLRLADGSHAVGRFDKDRCLWVQADAKPNAILDGLLIPRPVAWSECDCCGCRKIGICNFAEG